MDINYELYKVFYYVAKSLSFSDASKKLYISQSAVSQSVKSLEKKLNRPLFIRSTKKVRLTPEGEVLFQHIEPAMNLIMKGESQILEANTLNGGQLRIGASDTICRYYLVNYIEQFHEHFPRVHIKVTNGTSRTVVDYLENGQVDIVVTNYPNRRVLNSIAETRIIKPFRDIFVASSHKFGELRGKRVSLEELLRYPILMLGKDSTTSEFLHSICQERNLELAPEVELASNDLLIDLARIGLGAAFVPDFCIAGNDPDLFRIEVNESFPERYLAVGYSKAVPVSEAARYFIDILN
ncbi:MAG: LysR family transcriptional regulator [Lachnospiraceae bacterium]|nr:LysR family transcriptional regulator [Lachnospiraceae bacterium]